MTELEKEINKNLNARNYDRVMELLEDEKSLSPYFYTLRGACIQLCENTKYTLADAEKFLLRAIEIDPRHLRAYIELSYLYLTKLHDKKKADRCLSAAKEIIKNSLVETLIGEFQINMREDLLIDPIDLLHEFEDSILEHPEFAGLIETVAKERE